MIDFQLTVSLVLFDFPTLAIIGTAECVEI